MTASRQFRAADGFWIGVVLIFAANILLPLQDALAKQIISVLAVWQLLFLRSLTVVALTLVVGRAPLVQRALRTRLKRAMTLRSLLILAGWFAFYAALRDLPLAQATTIYFASPILVTLAAGPLLGERIGPVQWGTVVLGFAGVCLASGLASFQLSAAALLALFSTCCWAGALLMLRSMSKEEGSLVQLLFANGIFVLATGPLFLFLPFVTDWNVIVPALLLGIVGGAGQFALYEAARRLPASLLATLEYSAIVTAFVLGYLMFGEEPTLAITLGAVLVLLSGVVTIAAGNLGAARAVAPLALRSTLPAGQLDVLPPILSIEPEETSMSDYPHDHVVTVIARTRFPFPGQTTWAADYVTLTNVPERQRAIPTPAGDHYPDIVIHDGTGRIREIGEVEMTVSAESLPYLRAGSMIADDDTSARVRHFFLYVPSGLEAEAQALLDENAISYAGVRGFTVGDDGSVGIVPFVTPGDEYDHQVTAPQAA